MYCPYCNHENPEGSNFCNECGSHIKKIDSLGFSENQIENKPTEPEQFQFKIDVPEPNEKPTAKPTNDYMNFDYYDAGAYDLKHGRKKKSKKIIIACIVVFVVLTISAGAYLLKCDHVWSVASCTQPSTCSKCGKTRGDPLGHEWIDADCTRAKHCSLCDEEVGEPLEHTWLDATCTSPKICSECGEESGKPLGHSAGKYTTVKEATCTEEGSAETTCEVCGEIIEKSVAKKKHTPGEWVVLKQATIDTYGKKVCKCTVCGAVVKEKSFTISNSEYKNLCKNYSYDQIARNPNKYKGDQARFYGKAIQVMEESDSGGTSYTLRVALNGDYDKVILVSYYAGENESHILEDDYITLYGELKGTYTYKSTSGKSVTIPYLDAKIIYIS